MRIDKNHDSNCVKMTEYFYFTEGNLTYIALVFEKLGKSLYDFIKNNKYKGTYILIGIILLILGFSYECIRSFARQILEGIGFMHEKMDLTHTDLKVYILYLIYLCGVIFITFFIISIFNYCDHFDLLRLFPFIVLFY